MGSAAAVAVVAVAASVAGALERSAVGPDAAADAGSDFAIK